MSEYRASGLAVEGRGCCRGCCGRGVWKCRTTTSSSSSFASESLCDCGRRRFPVPWLCRDSFEPPNDEIATGATELALGTTGGAMVIAPNGTCCVTDPLFVGAAGKRVDGARRLA